MQLAKNIIFEYMLCYGVQAFVFILGLYAFSRRQIRKKPYIIASCMVFCLTVFIRFLPINVGIHTLLLILFTILVGIWYLKFPIYETTKSGLFIAMLLLAAEGANILILMVLFGADQFASLLNQPDTKFIAGIPATLLSLAATLIVYRALAKKGKLTTGAHN